MDVELLKNLLLLLLTGVSTVLFWNFKSLKEGGERLSAEFNIYKLYVAEKYASKGELSHSIDAMNFTMNQVNEQLRSIQSELTSMSNRFSDKLDMKQDK